MAEVTVSKIFPAGFGWQYGSSIAATLGYMPTDVGFALLTGVGDFSGVFLGHVFYYAGKKAFDNNINITEQAQVGALLASAAFCSGFAWQPLVNVFQASGIPFLNVAAGAWAGCGLAFFTGLRIFRTLYNPVLPHVATNSTKNFRDDACLSLSIGGASGAFVGTDVMYLSGDGNFLKDVVGVLPTDTVLIGCVKAGSSTSIGFIAAQSAQNVAEDKGKSWAY